MRVTIITDKMHNFTNNVKDVIDIVTQITCHYVMKNKNNTDTSANENAFLR